MWSEIRNWREQLAEPAVDWNEAVFAQPERGAGIRIRHVEAKQRGSVRIRSRIADGAYAAHEHVMQASPDQRDRWFTKAGCAQKPGQDARTVEWVVVLEMIETDIRHPMLCCRCDGIWRAIPLVDGEARIMGRFPI